MVKNYHAKYEKYKRKFEYLVKKLFPEKPGIDLTKLQFSETSIYSISKPKYAKMIVDIIKSFMTDEEFTNFIITDSSANAGGDTISFAYAFHAVNSVEMDSQEFTNLKNNVMVYKLDNVVLINNDYTKIMDNLCQDIVYMDPPWGGKNYKEFEFIDLYLSNINIIDIIYHLLTDQFAKIIVLKAPNNYNKVALEQKFYDSDFVIYTFNLPESETPKFKLFLITNKNRKKID